MGSQFKINGNKFIDEFGRHVILRGVNLGGSTKLPIGQETHLPIDYEDYQEVNFTGRPFPLDEADEHFGRLKHWGFNTLRLLTTWEAIEHKGPKQYDTKYIAYFTKLVKIAGDYGFCVLIDPHQDVWSRFTGGDGAPGWIFEKLGMDMKKFAKSDTAILMQNDIHNYEEMSWGFNYMRYVTATMFTLFFGGNEFAPQTFIENTLIQDYLQSHYINAISQIAREIKSMDHVLGFGPMNEPGSGWIGYPDIGQLPEEKLPGLVFTPFDSIVSASGHSRMVDIYKIKWFKIRKAGNSMLNRNRVSIWKDGEVDVWKQNGVWEEKNGIPKLLKGDHFAKNSNNEKAEFFRDYLRPFSIKFTNEIREIFPESVIFLEGDPLGLSKLTWETTDPTNVVYGGHWYDILTLFTKSFHSHVTVDRDTAKVVFLYRNIRKLFKKQLSSIGKIAETIHGGVPVLIGEFGIPYDMNKKKAYKNGNFKKHIEALSLYYEILDELHFNSTQWNYTADNNNQYGDLWNLEDLSIFSRDQQVDKTDLNSGGRAIEGFSRPYPMRIAGEIVSFGFNKKSKQFKLKYIPFGKRPSEIYVPNIHYPYGYRVRVNVSSVMKYTQNGQILTIECENSEPVEIIIERSN